MKPQKPKELVERLFRYHSRFALLNSVIREIHMLIAISNGDHSRP